MFISKKPNILFISPHFDDAVLSCGALIHKLVQNNNNVTILTVFGGKSNQTQYSKIAQKIHLSWKIQNPDQIIAIRQKEDIEALKTLGANAIHIDIPDCIYRTNNDGSFLYDYDNFDLILSYKVDAKDIKIYQIQSILKNNVNLNNYSVIYAPLGAGGHIDHILSRYLGESLFKLGKKVIFYADFYAIHKMELTKSLLLSNIHFSEFHKKLKEENIQAHILAVKKYTSQIEQLEQYYQIKFDRYCYNLAKNQQPKNDYSIKLWKPFFGQ